MDNSIVFIANSKGSCSLTFYTFIIKYSFLDLLNFWSNEHLCMLTIFCSTTTIKSITTSGYVDDRFKLKWFAKHRGNDVRIARAYWGPSAQVVLSSRHSNGDEENPFYRNKYLFELIVLEHPSSRESHLHRRLQRAIVNQHLPGYHEGWMVSGQENSFSLHFRSLANHGG